nr:retrovirus-related Pol polyprotein from transposon TNT 1-94 [Tanacetum cinerariifolium]
MLCYFEGMEPYYLKCIMDGPFQPKTADGDTKPESQWTPDERKGLRNANHTQNLDLADIYERFIYEDNLIQRRYSDTKKALITTPSSTLISTAFFSNNVIQNFQENSDDEVDESSSEGFSAGTSTEQVNSIQKLLTYSLITEVDIKEIIYSVSSAGTEVDIREIIYSDLITKLLNKSRLKYVSYPRFISCALQVLLGSDYTQDEKFSQKDSVSPLPLAAKPKKGKSQTGTCKSQPLPKSTATPPKDLGGNIQPLDRDLTSTTFDEGTAKTTSRPKGSLGDKDSGGNTPSTDMKPIHPTVAGQSGIGELDTQPLVLSTYADVIAFLLSDDEAQESKEDILRAVKESQSDILGAGEEMDEDPQATSIAETYHHTTIHDLYKGLNVITELLKEINNAVKDDPLINKKINEATKVILDNIFDFFEKLSDDIKAFVEITDSIAALIKRTHRGFY